MPKFLLISILVLVLAGYVFQVNDYSAASPPASGLDSGQMVVESKLDTNGDKIEIIKWPLVNGDENEDKLPVPVDGGSECLFFDGDIPRLDVCPT